MTPRNHAELKSQVEKLQATLDQVNALTLGRLGVEAANTITNAEQPITE